MKYRVQNEVAAQMNSWRARRPKTFVSWRLWHLSHQKLLLYGIKWLLPF